MKITEALENYEEVKIHLEPLKEIMANQNKITFMNR